MAEILNVAFPLNLLRPRPGGDLPLRVGDVVADAPRGRLVGLLVVPTVSPQRPHTGAWSILAHELGRIEEWVRTIAVPVLVAGRTDVPALPPQVDISTGYDDLRNALRDAGTVPAVQRSRTRFGAAAARTSFVEVLARTMAEPSRTPYESGLPH